MRFGKNIPADILQSLGSEVTLEFGKIQQSMDRQGVKPYSGDNSDVILKEALA